MICNIMDLFAFMNSTLTTINGNNEDGHKNQLMSNNKNYSLSDADLHYNISDESTMIIINLINTSTPIGNLTT